VVACPGRFMRGRHAYAMLKMMGLSETIGGDKSDYIQIAIELANDQRFHSKVKKKLLDNRHKLYGDQVFINGLEGFYKAIVQQKLCTGNDQYGQTTR
jgi:predicted O-linked N-acetylglucosamine transferase (SPINDLY family)